MAATDASSEKDELEHQIFLMYLRLRRWRKMPPSSVLLDELLELEMTINALLEQHHERWPQRTPA